MTNTKYTDQHEWVRVEGNVGWVGISDYAQHQLGDVVYVELPSLGQQINQGDSAAVVESVKAASDVYSPVSGQVIEINEALKSQPQLINESAESAGWFFKIELKQLSELDTLMDASAYREMIEI